MRVYDELEQWPTIWGIYNKRLKKFAQHGGNMQTKGVLVFDIREKAEKFCMSVAKGLGWHPKRMTLNDVKAWAEFYGGVCMTKGDAVIVAKPKETH